MEKLWYLSQIKIFSNLPKEDLIKMNGVTHMSTIPKHTIIQTPDSSLLGLYLVKKGKLRIYKLRQLRILYFVFLKMMILKSFYWKDPSLS